MSEPGPAIALVLSQEGGFSDDPVDPGGATNFGISLRYLRALGDLDRNGWPDGDFDHDGDVDVVDIRSLTRARAADLYERDWWSRLGYEDIASQDLANKLLSLAVNMGAHGAHRCLQRAIRATGTLILADGRLGPQTLAATNAAHPAALLPALRSEAAGYYRALIAQKPALRRYANGWENRAYA